MNRKRIFMFLLAAWLCLFHAQAAEEEHTQIEKDSQQLLWALPGEARDLLQGITPTQAAGQWDTAIMQMIQRIDAHRFIASAVRSLMKMLLVAVMIGVLSGLRGAAGGNELPIITMAGALGMTGILLHDLRGILALCINTLEQTSVFSTTLLPVMAGAMTISGAPATATATQAATMLALDLLIRFITSLLAPAVCAYIAIITVNAALGNDILGGLAGFIKWMTTGSLKFILTIFIAYLSISGALSGSVDAVALKTAKFALSGSVPVVGGIISDATESMLTGMAAILSRWEHQNTDAITQQVERAQKQQRAAIEQTVSQEIQSYFTRKAKEHGILCDIEIRTTVEEDQTVSIRNAVVHGTLTEEEYRWVEAMILTECELSQEDLRYVED